MLQRTVDSALALAPINLVPVIVGSNADESDAYFGAPARAFARLVTARGGRAWLYHFTRVAEDSVRHRGAYHTAEIPFVFGLPRPWPSAGRASYDALLAETMSDYWLAFATSKDPNGPPRAMTRPSWPAYDMTTDAYLELGRAVAAKRALRMVLYDSLDAMARRYGEIRPLTSPQR